MSKLAVDIVDELNEMLRKGGRPLMTLTWPEFYQICERERLKQPIMDGIREEASGKFQLVVAYGQNAVVICHDRNFATARKVTQ